MEFEVINNKTININTDENDKIDLQILSKEIDVDIKENSSIELESGLAFVNILYSNDFVAKYGDINSSIRLLDVVNYGDVPSYAWSSVNKLKSITLKNCENIGMYGFQGSSRLTEFKCDSVIKSIGSFAFQGCSNLNGQLVLDDNIEVIPARSFEGCVKLQVNLPKNLKEIESYGFYGCTNLEVKDFPENLEIIGIYAFRNCTNLTAEKLPKNLKEIGQNAFYGSGLSADELPAIESMGTYAFARSNVKFKEIPNGCSLSAYAFQNCTNLTNLVFKNDGTIPNYCFSNCTNLESIEIFGNITLINLRSFSGCSKLKTVTIHLLKPPTLTSNAFPTTLETIYVPSEALETYKTATNWSNFASKIVGI